jgi:hypothetical protein
VYNRSVDFKTINADIAIMSQYVEYIDSSMNKKTIEYKKDMQKLQTVNNSSEMDQSLQTLNVKYSNDDPNYAAYVKDNSRVDLLKKVAQKYKVKINKDKFKQLNIAKKSVDTYVEILQFQNEMMDNPQSMFKMNPDPQKYPNLIEFWNNAKQVSISGEESVISLDDSSRLQNPFNVNALVGVPGTEIRSRTDCGYFGNFKPSSKKSYQYYKYNNYSTALNTLRSWGYHDTSFYAEQNSTDHTRAQTYKPTSCGFLTFRDHANITDKNSLAKQSGGTPPFQINEQNYSGWVPRGEPNPEVFSSAPWPYAEWPAYVAAYHLKF